MSAEGYMVQWMLQEQFNLIKDSTGTIIHTGLAYQIWMALPIIMAVGLIVGGIIGWKISRRCGEDR